MKTKSLLCLATLLAFATSPIIAAEVSLETAPPVVVKTVPVAGATDVDPGLTEIKVTYSKAMQDGSWSWSTWGEENFPEMIGRPKYLADGRTCVLTVKLQPGKFYATWLNSDKFKNFKDTSGRPAVPYLLTFSTAGAGAAVSIPAAEVVDQAIQTISQCAEGDPRVTAAMTKLRSVPEAKVIPSLVGYLDSPQDTIRRSAIYVLWLGGFTDLGSADEPLQKLLTHREDLTRGMAALALGQNHVGASFPALSRMAREDSSGYARRCAVYALGLLGDARAEPVLKAALKDPEALVQQNAQAALKLLEAKPGRDATAGAPKKQGAATADASLALLNDDQRSVLAWTDRQFRSFFDARTFAGWSDEERVNQERRLIDSLNGPLTRDYYQAIGTLAALRSTNALPKLREIAFDRADKDCRDRWMAIRALGIIGDKSAVPELVHLVYHGNVNTRWWAQISLVRLTGQNFAKDWNAWGNWWNAQNGQPPFKPEIIRWWSGQAEADRLAESLNESDQKFLEGLKPKAADMSPVSPEQAKRIRDAAPLMDAIRQQWRAANDAVNQDDTTNALAVLQTLVPKVEESRDVFQGTPMESGVRKTLELMDPLKRALQQSDFPTVKQLMLSIGELGRGIEGQLKLVETAGQPERDQAQTGEQYLQQQLKLANAGNYWAKFNLWEAFSKGRHEVARNPVEADKWLSELVKEAYLARFEPVNGFTPKTPKEMLDKFSEHCQLRSGRDSLGGASFFRTTKQDDKLIGSFLTATPDEFKAALQTNPSLKLISIEKVTPEMFLAHEAARQESL